MSIKKIWGSRIQSNGATFIAEAGMLFYDETDGELRLGDGVTPGGLPVSIRADLITTQSLLPQEDNVEDYDLGSPTRRWHHLFIGDGGIKFNGNTYPTEQTIPYIPGAQVDDIIPATDNGVDIGSPNRRLGNVYMGYRGLYLADTVTDQNINIRATAGTLFLDGVQNLQVGNLTIVDTTLTSASNNLDISIGATDDTGFFYVKRKAQFDNTTFSSTQAMVSMNASGVTEPVTIFPDTVLQTTGRLNKNSRIVQRSYGSSGEVGGDNAYSVWASYVARGNVANPSAIKANDILSRVSSNGYGTTTWGSGGTRIESVALENFTDSAKGSKINFWTTPVGSIVSQQVASITATGISANSITFTTDGSIQTSNAIPFSQKGVATGVATLGVDGRLTTEQIPSSLTGAITFQGGWNAFTNTPALSNGTGITGYQYIVTVGGDRNLGAGNVVYASGDTVTYGANVWNRVSGSSPISSISGNLHMQVGPTTGAVVIGINATPNATASTVVSRDASGNFQANTITATLAGQATSAITAATVTTGTQTAITAVGTLTSLAVTGNVTAGNVTSTTGTITAATGQFTNINSSLQTINANVGAFHTYANTALGSLATGANANTAAYLTTATGNISAGNVTVTNLVTAKNYSGQVRNLGTITAGAGTEITIDFATDHMVRFNYTTEPVQVAFTNYSAGKTVTLIAVNTNAANRVLELGIAAANTQGDATIDINGVTTGIVTYYCTGTTVDDVYASTVYVI
jgi:hypothetical protein